MRISHRNTNTRQGASRKNESNWYGTECWGRPRQARTHTRAKKLRPSRRQYSLNCGKSRSKQQAREGQPDHQGQESDEADREPEPSHKEIYYRGSTATTTCLNALSNFLALSRFLCLFTYLFTPCGCQKRRLSRAATDWRPSLFHKQKAIGCLHSLRPKTVSKERVRSPAALPASSKTLHDRIGGL